MFGTTKPYGVAMAIPMLWEPKIITKNSNDSCEENGGKGETDTMILWTKQLKVIAAYHG